MVGQKMNTNLLVLATDAEKQKSNQRPGLSLMHLNVRISRVP